MADRRYIVGERVLASRAENGNDHEEATVVDYYVLLTEGGSMPSIVVDFDDGERKYMNATEPDILPLPEEEEGDEPPPDPDDAPDSADSEDEE
jgi:hypothetical protein